MTSISASRTLVLAFLALLGGLGLTRAAAAQDVVTVGTAIADGATVDVPVYIRDTAGSPLGMDQPPASRIQALSIRVTYAPASAISSVTFSRAGITAGLSTVFETAPASSGAISLLASFQQSTNPIPFSLDAGLPGDEVAHLVFTLSPSATAGTNIALSLDAATTQLTDEGGTAATKETAGNGQLALVDGAIQIPVPSITLTPSTQAVNAGGSVALTVQASSRMIADTIVTLTSSSPSIASVASSTTIAAGSRSTMFDVAAVSVGSATLTATLPASAGGASAIAEVNVTEGPQCGSVSAPQISAPASALAGATYSISWPAVTGATEYSIDEAADPSFAGATSRTVTTTSASYSHASAGRYYYRVRARAHAGPCDVTSSNSTTVSVLITTVVVPAVRVLPAVGSLQGNGAFFKTSLQLYNPWSTAISGKIVFHKEGESGSDADPSLAYSILPGKTLAYSDLLPAMGIAGGLGSADLIADAGSAMAVTLARVFSDGGSDGTKGLAFEAVPVDDALKAGNTGVLLAPADPAKFRFNVGVRTLEQHVAIKVTVRDRDGVVVKTLTKTYDPTYFKQVGSGEFLEGLDLAGGETISLEVTSGSAFLYGATTDNITADPSLQLARRLE